MSAYAMSNSYSSFRASVSGPSTNLVSALTTQPQPQPPQPQPDNNLLKVFQSLFETGKYSDLVIKCQGQRWKAHRAVVCSQSRPLAAAIDGNFRESATGEIDLEEDEPEIIGFMLEYLYTGSVSIDTTPGSNENPIDLESAPQNSSAAPSAYQGFRRPPANSNPVPIPFGYSPVVNSGSGANFGSLSYSSSPLSYPVTTFTAPFSSLRANETFLDIPPSPVTPPVNPQNLVTLAAIYVTAEKYDVQPLKVLAREKYESILSSSWNTEHFVDSLKLIYDGTPEMSEPDSLRDLAIKTAAAHAKELMDRGEFLNLCKERGDFATDVLKASLHQASAVESYGSGIPRCRVDPNHGIQVLQASRTYNGQLTQRYKCHVCNTFLN